MPAWLRTILAVCIIAVFSAGFYYAIRPHAYRWKPCYGQKGYGVCMPCDYEVHGIDISHYQGSIDWVQLTTNKTTKFPIHFVFMKATEGGDHADDTSRSILIRRIVMVLFAEHTISSPKNRSAKTSRILFVRSSLFPEIYHRA